MSSAALLGARDMICPPRSGLTSWLLCGTSHMWVLLRLSSPPAGTVTMYEHGSTVTVFRVLLRLASISVLLDQIDLLLFVLEQVLGVA